MENNNSSRPFVLRLDDAKQEIIQSVNNAINIHQIPCCIVDMILLDIYSQVKDGAKKEMEAAKQQVIAEETAKK